MSVSRRTIALPFPLDLRRTLGPVRRGAGDPTFRFAADGCWRATRTADGPATVHVRHVGQALMAEAWGPGADRVLDEVPALVGFHDDPADFAPGHRLLARLHHERPGLRIGRTGAVVEAMVPSILEQKVTGMEALRSYRQLVRTYGEPAPGPAGLTLAPRPEVLAALPYHRFHVLGVEKKRAETVRRVCARADRIEPTTSLTSIDAQARWCAVPGVGPWTAAEVALVAFGDADAVPVGDYHVPSMVTWALAGERRGTDQRMLELLEPFSGHRGRVVRLLGSAGLMAPRRGPRMSPRNIARH